MAAVLLRLFALLLGSFLLTGSTAFQGLLLPVRGGMEGFPTFSLGLLGTTWAIGFVAGCILVPRLVARVGHIRSFGVMCSISAVVILLNLLVIDPWFWVFSRAFTGFCMAGGFMVIESWLNEQASPENRGTIFAIYMIVVTLGYTTGQLGLGALDPLTFVPFVVCAIGYCLALLPTALSTSAVPSPLARTTIDIKSLRETSPVAVFTIVGVGLINGAFGTLAPLYGQQVGLGTSIIALFMAGATVGGALSQLPLGRLSDRIDRRIVIAGVGLFACLMSLGFILSGGGSGALPVLLAFLFGALVYPLYSLAVAHANDLTPPDGFTQTASTLLLLYGMGTMLGPIFASLLMNLGGPSGLFIFTALTQIAIFAYAAWRVTHYARTLKDKTDFQPIPLARAQTPESVIFDPRHDEAAEAEEPVYYEEELATTSEEDSEPQPSV